MARTYPKITKKRDGSFFGNKDGAVAIIFAASLVPLVIAVGAAIDYGRALHVKTQLQSATDAAALAGASMAANSANGDRQTAAIGVLISNVTALGNANGLQKTISFGNNSIEVRTSLKVPTTLAKLITPEILVGATSKAQFGSGLSTSAPLCLLALNKAAPDTFKAWGTADLIAPDCAVQSHSVDLAGMAVGGSATATAAHFCSAGGHAGTAFKPAVEDNCTPTDDPYIGKYTADALLKSSPAINVLAACNESTPVDLKKQENLVFNAGGPTNTYVFCDFVKLGAGAVVTFQPGVYVFTDYLLVSSGSALNAPAGVTFYFVDKNTFSGAKEANTPLTVQGGADFNLVAPTSGPLAGMAIVHPLVSAYTGDTKPVSTHTIIGGGKVNIVGTIYSPQAKVRVTGNGTINDTSNYFSIIADFVELEGNGQLYINAGADAMATGLPPMPSSGGDQIPATLTN